MRHPLLGLAESKDPPEDDAGGDRDAANDFHGGAGVEIEGASAPE
jgi:hypothetical protein